MNILSDVMENLIDKVMYFGPFLEFDKLIMQTTVSRSDIFPRFRLKFLHNN